jgi:hypothetical protein
MTVFRWPHEESPKKGTIDKDGRLQRTRFIRSPDSTNEIRRDALAAIGVLWMLRSRSRRTLRADHGAHHTGDEDKEHQPEP